MIDFSAREQHFADHLHPIWEALPPELRGEFFTGPGIQLPGVACTVGLPAHGGGPVVGAAWGDLRELRRLHRPVILSEHGAGQSYITTRHSSYAGGKGRETVALFLVPNQQAAKRNHRYYPHTPTAVVGSPRVDQLRQVHRAPGPTTVAVSFHWRCKVVPEAGTAFDHYAAGLADTRAALAAAGVTLLGHAHPRLYPEAAPLYEQAGIEPVRSFEEVVARADLLAVDNSSVLFEFAALDRPVVVLNSPRYRRRVNHGLRFWVESAVGLNVEHPAHLAATILTALTDPHPQAEARRATVGRVYPVPAGSAAQMAAEALEGLLARLVAC